MVDFSTAGEPWQEHDQREMERDQREMEQELFRGDAQIFKREEEEEKTERGSNLEERLHGAPMLDPSQRVQELNPVQDTPEMLGYGSQRHDPSDGPGNLYSGSHREGPENLYDNDPQRPEPASFAYRRDPHSHDMSEGYHP